MGDSSRLTRRQMSVALTATSGGWAVSGAVRAASPAA